MYPPIVCFCGRVLGNIYVLYCVAKAKLLAQKGLDIDPAQIPSCDGIDTSLEKLGDALGILRECCRVRLVTQREFRHECGDEIFDTA